MTNGSSAPVLRADTGKNQLEKIAAINIAFKERETKARAKKLGLPYIDLKTAVVNQDALRFATWEEVMEAQAVPYGLMGKILQIAIVDPASTKTASMIDRFQKKGYEVERWICSPEGLSGTQHYFENLVKQKEVPLFTTVVEEEGAIRNWKEAFTPFQEVFAQGTGPEIVNLINVQAIRFKASDVHFQPQEQEVMVRMRCDGQLHFVLQLAHKAYLLLKTEIKRNAGLKINITETPQDGEYHFIVNQRKISMRVSTIPSKYGEAIVLRVLDAEHAMVELDRLGFSETNKKIMVEKLQKDRGLILVTGPTGSGKTSTLYSCLKSINTPEKKIMTLEDPIEYELESVVQSEIHIDAGYTFATGLRAILRQDPDVIMVGEIRDVETADTCLQASLTGHLVLSTVHANDAIATIPRLLNMGVKGYILASGLDLIIAQRLVRKICERCKTTAQLSEEAKKELESIVASLKKKGIANLELQVFSGKGCEQCAYEGYAGRIAIAESLPITDTLKRSILAGESADLMLQKAEEEGFIRIKEDGILKVLQGHTTLEEVWKVLV